MPVLLTLRRSAGLIAVPVLLAVLLAQVLFRSQTWTYEWTWAFYQLGFNTVLIGPIVAGIAAWEGSRLASASDAIGTAPRNWRVFLAHWLGIVVWASAAYLVGLLVAVVMVLMQGTPWGPRLVDLLSVATALSLLAAEACAGLVLGWLLGRRLVSAPLAAIGCFCITLWLYLMGPGQFIIVGGATGSLAGLTPRTQVQIAQIAFFLSAAVAVLLVAGRRRAWGKRRGLGPPIASICLAAMATFGVLGTGRTLLVPRNEPLTCFGDSPQICTAAGYQRFASDAHDTLHPFVAALKDAGVTPLPLRFEQGAVPGMAPTAPFDIDFLGGDKSRAVNLIVASYVSKQCSFKSDPRVTTALSGMQWWLSQRGGIPYDDDSLPPELTKGTPPQQAAFIRDAARVLSQCSPPAVIRIHWAAWRFNGFVICLALVGVLLLLTPRNTVAVPGRDGVYSVLWPLVPVLVGMWVIAGLRPAYLDIRLTAVRRVFDRALAVAGSSAGAMLVVGVAPAAQHTVLYRNVAYTLGVSFICVATLPRSFAWIPSVIPPMIMWLLGTRSDGPPQGWAVLLRPEDDHAALAVAVAAYAVGTTLLLGLRDGLAKSHR